MSRDNRGFWIFDLPKLTPEVLEEFDTLPIDSYTAGGQRFRRFSTFRMWYADSQWHTEQMPQRAFLQPKAYNSLVGGVTRVFEPIRFDPTEQMAVVCEQIGLPQSEEYALNLHQIRVQTNSEIRGILVPEGPHQDGHALVLTAVFRRHNITGGVSELIPLGGGEPFFATTLEPNQALVIEDEKMWHFATEIFSIDATLGYRDIWIVSINPWTARRYGEEFERRASSQV